MSINYYITRLTLEESQEYYELLKKNHLDASAANEVELKMQIDDLPNDLPQFFNPEVFLQTKHWVAKNKETGEMLGGAGMRVDKEGDPTVEYLIAVAVKESARNQGIGSALIEVALSNHEPTTKTIKLNTLDRFQSAIRLYKKANFEITDEIKVYDWVLIKMKKDL